MDKEKNQHEPVAGRERQARQTWFWTHLFFGLLFIAVAAIVFQRTARKGLAIIFCVVGLIELVNVFTNPFKRGKK
jgi:hypothetical protein